MQSLNSDLETLSARVEKLERQNRLFKRAVLALLLLPVTLLVMGQAAPTRTLEAQAFILRGANGSKMAELGVAENGLPVLEFYDSNQDRRVSLGVVKAGSGLAFFNPTGKTMAGLSALGTDPRLDLYDADGNATTSVSNASIFMTPTDRQQAIELLVGDAGPSITIGSEGGFQSILGTTNLQTANTGEQHKTSAASLVLFGKDGKVLWSAP